MVDVILSLVKCWNCQWIENFSAIWLRIHSVRDKSSSGQISCSGAVTLLIKALTPHLSRLRPNELQPLTAPDLAFPRDTHTKRRWRQGERAIEGWDDSRKRGIEQREPCQCWQKRSELTSRCLEMRLGTCFWFLDSKSNRLQQKFLYQDWTN